MTTSQTRRRVRARGVLLGFIATASAALLMAPQAAADPRTDAEKAITTLAAQVQKGDADQGQAGNGLGAKRGGIVPVGDGFEQKFAGGSVFWSEKTGAAVLYGAILDKFRSEQGPAGTLGFPASNEGPAEYRPVSRVAKFAAADAPKIYWTPSTGAWVVRGPMSAATDKLGADLGAPAAAATTSGDQITQKFANGSLTFNKATGAWASSPNGNWATSLSGVAIPGMPDVGTPDATTPAAESTAPGGDTTTEAAGSEESEFNWWWLIIPFLIILLGLLLAWLWRNLRRPAATTPDPQLVGADAGTATTTTRDRPDAGRTADLKTSTTGTAAAAAAGAAAAGAALKGRRDESGADTTASGVADTGDGDGIGLGTAGLAGVAGVGSAAAAGAAAASAAKHGSGDGIGTYVKGGVETPVPVGGHLPLDDRAEAPDGYPIKGDADSSRYHTPDQPSYREIVAEIWFATESAAEAAGYHKADTSE